MNAAGAASIGIGVGLGAVVASVRDAKHWDNAEKRSELAWMIPVTLAVGGGIGMLLVHGKDSNTWISRYAAANRAGDLATKEALAGMLKLTPEQVSAKTLDKSIYSTVTSTARKDFFKLNVNDNLVGSLSVAAAGYGVGNAVVNGPGLLLTDAAE